MNAYTAEGLRAWPRDLSTAHGELDASMRTHPADESATSDWGVFVSWDRSQRVAQLQRETRALPMLARASGVPL